MKNIEMSRIFDKIAKILRIQNDNPFKIRAYEHVAEIIENLPIEVESIYRTGKLEEIPGVGDAIAKKIEELIKVFYNTDISKTNAEARSTFDAFIKSYKKMSGKK